MLPFTSEVFLSNMGQYNAAIWPAQIAAYALGALALLFALRPVTGGGRAIGAILAAFWLWNGVAYHWLHFARINFLASAFALLFVLQGLLLLWSTVLRGGVAFRFRADLAGWSGLGLALFAMLAYPLLGWLAGHGWPKSPAFGVSPCPTTIFTLGMLLLAAGRTPWHLAALPLLWSLIGGTAVWLLDMPEETSLLAAGLLTFALVIWGNRQPA